MPAVLSTDLNQVLAGTSDHLDIIPDKFSKNLKSGLGSDAITIVTVLSKGKVAISKMAVWWHYKSVDWKCCH